MNSLEYIEKEIEVTKKQLNKYPLTKEQSDPNYKHKEADIQYVHNKFYTEQLQTLQQIKLELEAWYAIKPYVVVKKGFVNLYENDFKSIEFKEGCIDELASGEDYENVQKIVQALEVKACQKEE